MLIYSADGTRVIRAGHDAITSEDLKRAADELETIEGYYTGHEGDVANRTKELLKINPALRDNLLLSPYEQFVPPDSRAESDAGQQ